MLEGGGERLLQIHDPYEAIYTSREGGAHKASDGCDAQVPVFRTVTSEDRYSIYFIAAV